MSSSEPMPVETDAGAGGEGAAAAVGGSAAPEEEEDEATAEEAANARAPPVRTGARRVNDGMM
jgi:hypothetical protein